MDRTTKLAFLQRCRLFAGVPPEPLEQIASLARPQDLAGGEVLWFQDTPATALCVVASGRLRVTRTHGNTVVDLTHHAGPGAALGLAGLLAAGVYPASALALRPSSLLRLDAEDLRATLEGDQRLGVVVWRNADLLLAERLRWLACLCAELAARPELLPEQEVAVSGPVALRPATPRVLGARAASPPQETPRRMAS